MKKIKYSNNFNRDYYFYLNNLENFSFTGGKINKKNILISSEGKSAKECLYYKESEGKDILCNEPELFNQLLDCKAGINFAIKQWAEARIEGTLPLIELSKNYLYNIYPEKYPNRNELENQGLTLEWINNNPIYHRDIQTQFSLPDWVIDAIEGQVYKNRNYNKNNYK